MELKWHDIKLTQPDIGGKYIVMQADTGYTEYVECIQMVVRTTKERTKTEFVFQIIGENCSPWFEIEWFFPIPENVIPKQEQ